MKRTGRIRTDKNWWIYRPFTSNFFPIQIYPVSGFFRLIRFIRVQKYRHPHATKKRLQKINSWTMATFPLFFNAISN
jgi:hypothetical protein